MSRLAGLNHLLWPIRYKPLPDELLSCWLIRLAHGHGLKVQTFCNLIFGNRRQVWNRDVDRLSPQWLVEELCNRTGTPISVAQSTSLKGLNGKLFNQFKATGTLPWVLTMGMYHRKRAAYGQQYCPLCLGSDIVPYYRVSWRLAFMTFCPEHLVLLSDRCPECAAPINFHRGEMGKGGLDEAHEMTMCHECMADLRTTPVVELHAYLPEIKDWLVGLASGGVTSVQLDDWNVMHHFSKLLLSEVTKVRLYEHLRLQEGAPELPKPNGRVSIESCDLTMRHHLMQLVAYLMLDIEGRLGDAWRMRALRYNHMLKGFSRPPHQYQSLVGQFMNWRDRL